MTLAEFTSALAANMLTVAGLQVLVTALTHAKPWARFTSTKVPPAGEFYEPMQTEVDQLLRTQRANHPHLAEPVPWHGTEPLERAGATHTENRTRVNTSEIIPPHEVERIMARVRAFAHDNVSPEEADLIIRDLESWRQHPIQDPHIRRKKVDASAFLPRAQWFHDRISEALRTGFDKDYASLHKRFTKMAPGVISKARKILDRGTMSLAELGDLTVLYLNALRAWSYRAELRNLQPPTLPSHGHFGERASNAAGVLGAGRAGLYAPGESDRIFSGGGLTMHDYRHTGRLATEYAPDFHSYLAAVDRRIDFAEALDGFAKLLSGRERQLLESVRFAARWENGFAPTAEHTWGATRSNVPWISMDENLVNATIRVEQEKGNAVSRQEIEQVVSMFRTFIENYLRWLPDGARRKRNALFAEQLIKDGRDRGLVNGQLLNHVIGPLGARTSSATSAAQLTLSPEEVLAFLKVDPRAPGEALSSQKETKGLRQFVEKFISEHPLSGQ